MGVGWAWGAAAGAGWWCAGLCTACGGPAGTASTCIGCIVGTLLAQACGGQPWTVSGRVASQRHAVPSRLQEAQSWESPTAAQYQPLRTGDQLDLRAAMLALRYSQEGGLQVCGGAWARSSTPRS